MDHRGLLESGVGWRICIRPPGSDERRLCGRVDLFRAACETRSQLCSAVFFLQREQLDLSGARSISVRQARRGEEFIGKSAVSNSRRFHCQALPRVDELAFANDGESDQSLSSAGYFV